MERQEFNVTIERFVRQLVTIGPVKAADQEEAAKRALLRASDGVNWQEYNPVGDKHLNDLPPTMRVVSVRNCTTGKTTKISPPAVNKVAPKRIEV
jgi:hypothetical protein